MRAFYEQLSQDLSIDAYTTIRRIHGPGHAWEEGVVHARREDCIANHLAGVVDSKGTAIAPSERTEVGQAPILPEEGVRRAGDQGRALFVQAGCAQCHGGQNWTVSLKDFVSPPAALEIFTERTGTFTNNPVGAQYLNRFLRDIGSFNLGVPGQGGRERAGAARSNRVAARFRRRRGGRPANP